MLARHLACALVSWRKDPQVIAAWPLCPLTMVLSAAGGSQHLSSTPRFQGGCREFGSLSWFYQLRPPLGVGSGIRDVCPSCRGAGAPRPNAHTSSDCPAGTGRASAFVSALGHQHCDCLLLSHRTPGTEKSEMEIMT